MIGKVYRTVANALNSRTLSFLLSIAALVYFTYLSLASNASEGGGDAIVHYRIARYSWRYPELFMDMWGKPVFTALSSLFAQFGFNNMKIFNVLVAVTTGILGFGILKRSGSPLSGLYFLLLFFTPIYFVLIPSTLTEPLFGLCLMTGIYLFQRNRYTLSALVIAFLPFIRNEGFLVFPFYAIALIYVKEWKRIPLLFLGYIFFGAVGFLSSGDMLWITHHMPYLKYGGQDYAYPNGTFWYYPDLLPDLYGKVLYYGGWIGTIVLLAFALRYRKKSELLTILLVLLPLITYILAHSLIYWKGPGVAHGLHRLMAPVAPLAGLIAIDGISKLIHLLRTKSNALALGFMGVAFAMILLGTSAPYRQYRVPLPLGPQETLITEAAAWMKSAGLDNALLCYHHPYVCHALDKDPFDPEQSRELFAAGIPVKDLVPAGAVYVWDSHFAPVERSLPLDTIAACHCLELLKTFPADTSIHYPNEFTLHIFRRVPGRSVSGGAIDLNIRLYLQRQWYMFPHDAGLPGR